jgi:hypothetical protein
VAKREGRPGPEPVCSVKGAQSFRVALRPQPVYASTSLQPLVNFSFALKSLDVLNFGTGAMSLDLPVALCDALVFKDDPRRFTHGHQYAVVRVRAARRISGRPPKPRLDPDLIRELTPKKQGRSWAGCSEVLHRRRVASAVGSTVSTICSGSTTAPSASSATRSTPRLVGPSPRRSRTVPGACGRSALIKDGGSGAVVPATFAERPLLLPLRVSCCIAANRRSGPKPDIRVTYSMTSPARASSDGGTVKPSLGGLKIDEESQISSAASPAGRRGLAPIRRMRLT